MENQQKRYRGQCPFCGKELWICKSILMEMGINTGGGSCIGCGKYLHIAFDKVKQEMQCEPFEAYVEREGRMEAAGYAGTNEQGGYLPELQTGPEERGADRNIGRSELLR